MDNLYLLAQYNIWATKQLNKTLRVVSKENFYKDNGLFFKSIFATLNHLLVGEHYLWFPRFSTGTSPHLALNTIIEHNHIKLLDELEHKAKNWITLLSNLSDEKLKGNLCYTSSQGNQYCVPYSDVLHHVFMHGTHHRGQITAALTHMGYECPEIDLVYMLIDRQKNNDYLT